MVLACDILTTVLLALGCLIALTGSLGALRLPDFYSRLHATGKTDSLAQVLILVALLIQAPRHPDIGFGALVRLALVTLFILFTSPIATHAVARAAHAAGLVPWTRKSEPERD